MVLNSYSTVSDSALLTNRGTPVLQWGHPAEVTVLTVAVPKPLTAHKWSLYKFAEACLSVCTGGATIEKIETHATTEHQTDISH